MVYLVGNLLSVTVVTITKAVGLSSDGLGTRVVGVHSEFSIEAATGNICRVENKGEISENGHNFMYLAMV